MYLGKKTKPSDNKILTKALENLEKGVEELGTVPVANQEYALEKILGPLILEAKKRGAKRIIMPNLEKIAQARGEEITSVKKGDVELNLNPYKLPIKTITSKNSPLNPLYQKKITSQDIADIINEAQANPNLTFNDDGTIKPVRFGFGFGTTKLATLVFDIFSALEDLPT